MVTYSDLGKSCYFLFVAREFFERLLFKKISLFRINNLYAHEYIYHIYEYVSSTPQARGIEYTGSILFFFILINISRCLNNRSNKLSLLNFAW